MARRGQGLTGRIRAAAVELGKDGNEFGLDELGDKIGIQTYADRKRVHWMLRDLRRSGELVVVHRGRYRVAPEKADGKRPPPKHEVMWRVLRGRRAVSVDDLVEFAAVKASYARQWLRMLVRRGVVRKLSAAGGDKYQLVKDSVDSPADTEQAERLRELRAKRKAQALAALAKARGDMGEVCGRLSLGLDLARSALDFVAQAMTELEEIGEGER